MKPTLGACTEWGPATLTFSEKKKIKFRNNAEVYRINTPLTPNKHHQQMTVAWWGHAGTIGCSHSFCGKQHPTPHPTPPHTLARQLCLSWHSPTLNSIQVEKPHMAFFFLPLTRNPAECYIEISNTGNRFSGTVSLDKMSFLW